MNKTVTRYNTGNPIIIYRDGASPSQNVYQRWHWSQKARYRDDWILFIRHYLAMRPGITVHEPMQRLVVDVTRYGLRQLDYGNCVGGCKPILDALVMSGAIHDDSPTWIEERYAQVKVAKKNDEHMIIRIWPSTEAPTANERSQRAGA